MLSGCLVFLPFAASVACYLIGRRSERARDLFAAGVTLAELALAILLAALTARAGGGAISSAALALPTVFTSGISLTVDGFRAVYALVTAVMWAGTTLFSLEYFREEREGLNRYFLFVLMTLGATEGVMLSADLMTTFLFFEILSLTSFTWVIHEQTPGAIRAAYTYLFIAVIGGLVLFMGLVLLNNQVGTLRFSELSAAVAELDPAGKRTVFAAGLCILVGFGAKAGMFPVHVWLPKAHPVAPSPASALLSGVLTKVGVYGILMTTLNALMDNQTYGWIVLALGVITMFLGALLALFSVNLKRTLACSSMSQIGFILVGIGMAVLLASAGAHEAAEESLAGAMLHMLNHSMLKLALFCIAGVVVMNLHKLDLNAIRGFGRNKTMLKIAFLLGLLGISGVPCFNGYASKTLLHEAIVAGTKAMSARAGLLKAIEWIFLVSGGCTFGYMLKLFLCVFVEKNEDAAVQAKYDEGKSSMNRLSGAVILGTAVLFVLLGQKFVFSPIASFMTGAPGVLHHYAPLSWECLSGGLISLGIGAALYLGLIRLGLMKGGRYVNRWPDWLDLEDLLYRPLLTKWLPGIGGAIAAVFGENKVLRPLCRLLLKGGKAFARAFGENRLLAPLSAALMTALKFLARALSDLPDALVVLARGTVLREARTTARDARVSVFGRLRAETQEAFAPIRGNFSTAMTFVCLGIVIILGTMVVLMIR